MRIPQDIKSVEIYYDGNCGICNRFALWLEKQERALELTLMPYQEALQKDIFPDLMSYHPDRELVCRTDSQEVFCGAEAWVMSLQSCKSYQGVAKHLSNRFMLPTAEKVCKLVSSNRIGMSKFLFRGGHEKVKHELEELQKEHAEPKDKFCDTPDSK